VEVANANKQNVDKPVVSLRQCC